ncbi:aminotransferase family protein [[Clostridium] polysaccharolyticum]|uniref:Adenosylmethionine-8-amino-7-oxononanoate aminotransferase n=1 Tax=[Clostridium] polysaccharolyticum TaxID=29364 RepID=A0A1I0DY19_9FIRM|nr:aspartate aminotransferase family protein [[Clostridium] polysaccharolyticum]SET37619.1 adenosylmethionine-8-amino-7-oxononanoate aminotransferase [[Clostridium] polysaccharolyticum]
MSFNLVVRINQQFDEESKDSLIVSAEDCYIKDSNGKEYIDLCGGIWNTPFGYSNEYINQKIIEQTTKIPFCNLISNVAEVQYTYAESLCKMLGTSAVLYTCSGSESLEAAVKTCRQYQHLKKKNRATIAALNLSYHGTSYGAMSISGLDREINKEYYPLLPNITWMEVPKDYKDAHAWIQMFEKKFEESVEELSGVVVEPVLGSGGIVAIPYEALKRLEELCRKNDVLFVLDEVTTGFGRTGVPFVFQSYGLQPDLICLSKGITNGYMPLGVVAFSEHVCQTFADSKATLEHFSSQGGNLLSIAAASAVLDLMEKYDSFQVKEKGEQFCKEILEAAGDNFNCEIRGFGLMCAISFPIEVTPIRLLEIVGKLKKRGIIVYYFCNDGYNLGLSFFPPFTCSFAELSKCVKKIVGVLKKCPELWKKIG